MNNISFFDSCANCGACVNVCPKNAISVNKQGLFFEVAVDNDQCIQCGKCIKVCPLNSFVPHLDLRSAYGGWSNDSDILQRSSSGGAFSVISNYVLNNKGVVYGAVFSDDHKEVVFKSTKEVSLDEIRRSKYLESQPRYVFREIKADLEKGTMVLFCGSPCQVAGLKRYLDIDYSNLLTCDFTCGGMVSHKMYEDYLIDLENKYHSKVKNVNFRPKMYGWSIYSIQVDFNNGKKYKNICIYDPYMYSFLYGRTSIRENCYECKFRDNHYCDLIIADFWKWSSISNLENDERGISLIITNSQKGEDIICEIKPEMTLKELDLKDADYNCKPNPQVSEDDVAKRNRFIDTYKRSGLLKADIEIGMKHGFEAKIRKAYTVFRRGIHIK